MNSEQLVEALDTQIAYRRKLIETVNNFPEQSSIQDIVDIAVSLKMVIHAAHTGEPVTTINRYATVTEIIAPPESEDEDATGTEAG